MLIYQILKELRSYMQGRSVFTLTWLYKQSFLSLNLSSIWYLFTTYANNFNLYSLSVISLVLSRAFSEEASCSRWCQSWIHVLQYTLPSSESLYIDNKTLVPDKLFTNSDTLLSTSTLVVTCGDLCHIRLGHMPYLVWNISQFVHNSFLIK